MIDHDEHPSTATTGDQACSSCGGAGREAMTYARCAFCGGAGVVHRVLHARLAVVLTETRAGLNG